MAKLSEIQKNTPPGLGNQGVQGVTGTQGVQGTLGIQGVLGENGRVLKMILNDYA